MPTRKAPAKPRSPRVGGRPAGRPTLPPDERRTARTVVHLTDADYEAAHAAARAKGRSYNDWAARVIARELATSKTMPQHKLIYHEGQILVSDRNEADEVVESWIPRADTRHDLESVSSEPDDLALLDTLADRIAACDLARDRLSLTWQGRAALEDAIALYVDGCEWESSLGGYEMAVREVMERLGAA